MTILFMITIKTLSHLFLLPHQGLVADNLYHFVLPSLLFSLTSSDFISGVCSSLQSSLVSSVKVT